MIKEQQKIRALNKFKKLERHLLSLLGGEKRKVKIIRKINKEIPKGGRKRVYLLNLSLVVFYLITFVILPLKPL